MLLWRRKSWWLDVHADLQSVGPWCWRQWFGPVSFQQSMSVALRQHFPNQQRYHPNPEVIDFVPTGQKKTHEHPLTSGFCLLSVGTGTVSIHSQVKWLRSGHGHVIGSPSVVLMETWHLYWPTSCSPRFLRNAVMNTDVLDAGMLIAIHPPLHYSADAEFEHENDIKDTQKVTTVIS